MPLYEFECDVCGLEFEELLPVDSNNPECSNCHGTTHKFLSSFSSVVKGSSHRTIDHVIGADAEKRWEKVYARKDKRAKERQKV
jgi:putative FmdB family regulatory protein